MEGLYLGIDIGTSRSKGVVVDPAGLIVHRAQVAHTMSLPRPGHGSYLLVGHPGGASAP